MSRTLTWRDVQRECIERLTQAGLGSAENDARRIVEQASGRTGADYHFALSEPATMLGASSAARMAERRAAGEPLQYVLGSWGFRQLDLFLDRRVLIPRPETETVVDQALAEVDRQARQRAARGDEGPTVVVDLGTGSGAIALSVAGERSGVEVWATDRSDDALAVARANLAGIGRRGTVVRFASGDWFDALPAALARSIDVIVSNPPYVAEGDPLPPEVADWEPTEALVSGPDGTEAVAALLDGAPRWLRPGGSLVVEISPLIDEVVANMASSVGFVDVRVHPDQLGRPRTLVARTP